MEENKRLGVLGEEAAAAEYRRRGYDIVCANYRTRFGEVDIAAFDGEYLCVCEVKTRRPGALVSGVEAVTPQKQKRIQAVTMELAQKLDMADRPIRFDVAVVTPRSPSLMEVELLENAFEGL